MANDNNKTDESSLPDITRLARDGRRADPDATVVMPQESAADSDPTVVLARPPEPEPKPEDTTPLALPAGFRLFEYRVDKVLGQGGFGITYLASDVNLNSRVAIKEYLPEQFACRTEDISVAPRSVTDGDFFERGLESYLVEARTLATFRHPNLVKVARFFEAHNTAYMVLEYEHGESLKKWWPRHKAMSEIDLLGLLSPLLDGLAVVHEAGFLHRDIKPDNIYVRDADGSLVLLDFGAARQVTKARSEEDNFVTPGYGPIEQYVLAEQGPWTDIYALGATLYWMICGRRPMQAPDRMVSPDPLVPAVEMGKGKYSPEFLAAIDWALKPETQDRPRDIAEFRKALFAAHPSIGNLQDALHAGEKAGGRIGQMLLHPGTWPLAIKMTIALVLTALTPMLIVAYYN
jgi:serine/threonine protein kinase